MLTNEDISPVLSTTKHVWQIRRDKQYQLTQHDCPNPAKYKNNLVLLAGKHVLGGGGYNRA